MLYNDYKVLKQNIKEGKNEVAIMTINDQEPKKLLRYDRLLLHWAVECDNLFIAQYLANNGWDLMAKNSDGDTPLALAIQRGNIDITSMLLRLFNIKKEKSVIEHIRFTAYRWPDDLKFIKLLLNRLTDACSNHDEIAEKLVRLQCPLAAAVCVFKDATLTKLMLDRGSPVDGRLPSTGETALHLAVEHLDVNNVRLLVDHGAEIDAETYKNHTPLSLLSADSRKPHLSVQILKLLLERGASLTAICYRGQNAYSEFEFQNLPIMYKLLAEGDMQTLRTLIPYVDLCYTDKNGYSPFHQLVGNPNRHALEVLRGIDLDSNVPGNAARTPRDVAVQRAYFEKFRFLLERKHVSNDFDYNAHVAFQCLLYCVSDPQEVKSAFEILLLQGAKVEHLTYYRFTANALVKAIDEDVDFAKLLIAHLAKLESFGGSPNEFFQEKIKCSLTLEEYFDSCRKQIDRMKETIIYGNVTLYTLLSESKKRLTTYARNEEFRLHYESMKNDNYSIHPYYMKSLLLRVDEAISTAKIEIEAACIICRITGFPTSMVGTIAHIIVGYLNHNDLANIIKI